MLLIFVLWLNSLSLTYRYTLRKAEYRLCLEKNLEIYGGNDDKQKLEDCKSEADGSLLNDYGMEGISGHDKLPMSKKITESTPPLADFGEMNSETKQYILNLQSHLSSVKKVSNCLLISLLIFLYLDFALNSCILSTLNAEMIRQLSRLKPIQCNIFISFFRKFSYHLNQI